MGDLWYGGAMVWGTYGDLWWENYGMGTDGGLMRDLWYGIPNTTPHASRDGGDGDEEGRRHI